MKRINIKTMIPNLKSKKAWGIIREDCSYKEWEIFPGESLCKSDRDALKAAGFEWWGRYWHKWRNVQ